MRPGILSIRCVATLVLIGLVVQLSAQQRNFNWVFGSGVWLQFSADTMVSLTMTDTVSVRNACISDTAGQFVLLADDFGIRNALFGTVAGGSVQELGWNVPALQYLVLPLPGAGDRYGVFINEDRPTARAGWVEVDMEANGGAGAVVGGTHWYMQDVTAKLTATTDAAENGYWVLQHDDGDDAFQAFHLGSGGLSAAPVVTHAGTPFVAVPAGDDDMDRHGMMTFNFQGDILAVVKNGLSVDTSLIELFRFDRGSGSLSHWMDLSLEEYYAQPEVSMILGRRIRDVNFDHSGNYLYANHYLTAPGNTMHLYQYDLGLPPDSIIDQALQCFENGIGAYQDTIRFDNHYGAIAAVTPIGYAPVFGPLGPANDGCLIRRNPIDPGNYAQLPTTQSTRLLFLPRAAGAGSEIWTTHGWPSNYLGNTRIMAGLPSPCKRYTDQADVGSWIAGPAEAPVVLGLRPNPMEEQAALVFSGPVVDPRSRPEEVVWRNLAGQVVHRARVGQRGPSILLQRDGLPAGTYLVEVLAKDHRLGTVKVVCK